MPAHGVLMDHDQTIAAISTAPGTGAIAIVRLSGERAWQITSAMFALRASDPVGKHAFQSHRATHGFIKDSRTGHVIDEVMAIPYMSPNTYTGEDLVEINCHGGAVVTREILELTLALGARLARRGEFTERAFLNGKLDLTQAEAVLDLIQAKTTRQRGAALSALTGQLGDRIRMVQESVMRLLTAIVAGIDFPEEVGDAPVADIEETVGTALSDLEQLLRTLRSGRFLRMGMKLAIVGRPNAGKSSLLNQLLKFERAIVTDIPGTTRDSLEEMLDINGIPVTLIDTAGIRHTDDTVEKIGIERSRQAIEGADMALFVTDVTTGWGDEEEKIATMLGSKPYMMLANKTDLKSDFAWQEMDRENGRNNADAIASIQVSARTGAGMSEICSAIESWVIEDEALRHAGGSLNERQGELCQKAVQALRLVQTAVSDGLPQDCLATDLKSAVDALSEMCGEVVSEEVIKQVFASFCIGK